MLYAGLKAIDLQGNLPVYDFTRSNYSDVTMRISQCYGSAAVGTLVNPGAHATTAAQNREILSPHRISVRSFARSKRMPDVMRIERLGELFRPRV